MNFVLVFMFYVTKIIYVLTMFSVKMKIAWSPVDKTKFLTYTNSIINLYETKALQGEQVPKGMYSLHFYIVLLYHRTYLTVECLL